MTSRNIWQSIAATASVAALVVPANAYQVTPMILDLAPSGSGASTVLRVHNDSDRPITIEMVAEKRSFEEDGTERRTPAEDEFVIFPPQAVVPANATQAVRVQYIGDAALTQSETYTITVKQVPVRLPSDARTGVQVLFNFSTLANIVPVGAKPDVQVTSVEPGESGGYRVRLTNRGTKYANLAAASFTLGGSAVAADVWRKSLKTSWLLPGSDRVIMLPAGAGLPSNATAGRIDLGRQLS